ncbi:MAG: hypothetical protein U9N33_01245 [Campylobacterota bacterium]|nr:hypothetical protein [Campylobacterota bacterium]
MKVRLVVDIEEKLKSDFAKYTKNNDMDMSKELTKFIKNYVKKEKIKELNSEKNSD